jgi:hypothetical protein
MTWLFPLYLLGAGAVIAPILLHLRRRPPQDRVEFSSLMFLEASERLPVRNRRIEHWLLLALRCLAILLLAGMFARPWWSTASPVKLGEGTRWIVLVDDSASMRRGKMWDEAVAEARKIVTDAAAVDQVAVGVFDHRLRMLWSFEEDRRSVSGRAAAVGQRLAAAKPTWGGTKLGAALVEATSWAGARDGQSTTGKQPTRLVVISDLQEGASLDELSTAVWPQTMSVEFRRIEAPDLNDFSLQLAANVEEESDEPKSAKPPIKNRDRVRVSNARASSVTDFELYWQSQPNSRVQGFLPPGTSRVMSVPPRPAGDGPGVLMLSGDAWEFDNQVYVAPPQPLTVHLSFIGDAKTRDEASSPLFFLSRALQPTPTLKPELRVTESLDAASLADVQVVFVANSSAAKVDANAAKAWIANGGLLVWLLDDAKESPAISALWPRAELSIHESTESEDYRLLGEMNTAHPLLLPFGDSRLRDLTKVRFWHHRVMTWSEKGEGATPQVLAKFDNQDPAMVVASLGKGTLLVLTAGWHPRDSQLALSTKFVPLIFGWLEAAGFAHQEQQRLFAGDPLTLPKGVTAPIMNPDGTPLEQSPDGVAMASQTGFYKMRSQDGADHVLAVNLPPEEGRVMPMEESKLRDAGVPMMTAPSQSQAPVTAEESQRLAATEQESQQRVWWWILIGLLAVLVAETWVAGRRPVAAA